MVKDYKKTSGKRAGKKVQHFEKGGLVGIASGGPEERQRYRSDSKLQPGAKGRMANSRRESNAANERIVNSLLYSRALSDRVDGMRDMKTKDLPDPPSRKKK